MSEKRYVSKRNLREFRQEIKERWLAFLLQFILKLGSRKEAPVVEEKVALAVEKKVPRLFAKANPLLVALWIPAPVFYGFGDVSTTALALAAGEMETSLLLRILKGFPSDSIWIFGVTKTLILVVLLFLSFKMGKYGWIIPAILIALGTYLVINNLIALYGQT